MENDLDKVEDGDIKWKELLKKFYDPFKEVVKKTDTVNRVEIPMEVSDVKCDKCGRTMVIKSGRFGKFLACPGFPQCKNTKPLLDEAGVKCPKCEGKVIYRKTKRGRKYLGCENYPKCDFMTWDMPSDKVCPSCSSFMTKKTKGDITTYKCANPACTYTLEEHKEGPARTRAKRGTKKAAKTDAQTVSE
jgi:DNA topoisomerase-1